MTNDAGTNGGRGTAEHMSETTRRVAKRQKRVTRDGRFGFYAKRGPSRIRQNRGEATHKFADKRRCVQQRVSRSRGGRNGRKGELQERRRLRRQPLKGRMKTWVAAKRTEAQIRQTPMANETGNGRAQPRRLLPNIRRGEADKRPPVVCHVRRRQP